MDTTAVAEKKAFKTEIKKHIVLSLLTAICTGVAFFIPFYFKTSYSLPQLEEKYNVIENKVEKIEKDVQGPVIDSKVNNQRLDDIQRQMNEVKADIKAIGDNQAKNQQQLIDILKEK